MAFNQQIVKSASQGAQVPFTAPLAAYKGTVIALNTIAVGATAGAAGLVLPVAGPQFNISECALSAIVETNITTSTLTATTKWQVSNDGVNWLDLLGKNAAGNVTKSAAGSGSLVTTQYVQAFDGIDPAFPYIRLAVLVGGATGAAGDSVTASYQWRKRWAAA